MSSVDYDERDVGSHSNTRDDEEVLNNGRSKTVEAIKRTKHRKVPGVNDIMGEKMEATSICSGDKGLLRLFRTMGT